MGNRWVRGVLFRALALVCAGLATAGIMSSATKLSARPAAASSDINLADDSAGTSMFSIAAMSPGETVTRCIAVTASGASAPDDVRLYADVSGALADGLHLVLEVGQGGGFGSCVGFSGTTAYDGALDAFANAHSDYSSGLTAWAPDTSGRTSYRFDVSLFPSAAQGANATARFIWEEQASGDASVSPSPSPTQSSSASPTVSPSASPTASPDAVPSVSPSPSMQAPQPQGSQPAPPSPAPDNTAPSAAAPVSPLSSATAAPTAPVDTSASTSGRGAVVHLHRPRPSARAAVRTSPPSVAPAVARLRPPRGSTDGLTRFINRLPGPIRTVAHVIAPVVREPGLPALWLLLVFGFLALQNRIDRRDPKLALAPIFSDPYLTFPDQSEGQQP